MTACLLVNQNTKCNCLLFFLALLIPSVVFAQSETIDTAKTYPEAIGTYLSFYQEAASSLSPSQVLQKFDNGQFTQSNKAVLSFGLGAKPVWVALKVSNASLSASKRRLSIEAAWLDKIHLYFIVNKQLVKQVKVGDIYPFKDRPVDERFFSVPYDFPKGNTTILARIETPDPMIIPIYFSSETERYQRNLTQSYFYGMLYGALLSLLAYNFMLYYSLGLKQYLFYAIHIVTFIVMNMSYTGHGYQWLWPQLLAWQQWANSILIFAFGMTGILFAIQFLNSKQLLPGVHKMVIAIVSLFSFGMLLSLLTNNQLLADIIALTFISAYAWILITMGWGSLRSGNKAARYFILATVTAAFTASISAATVWGVIPFTDLRFRATEIGMVFDAVFLALALAHLFRVNDKKKVEAEKMARIDHLTSLNNRRAFNEYAAIIWNNAARQHEGLSIILLDIDNFKVINDTYGHTAGDDILIQLSAILKSENRTGDILARWGGEEFIILLPNTEEGSAVLIAERLRQEISAFPMDVGDETIKVSCSFGVASKSNHNETIEKLIAQSDQYLYHAKHSGRNRVSSSHDAHPLFQADNTA